MTLSSALVLGKRLNCWKTKPIVLLRMYAVWVSERFSIFLPLTITCPDDGLSNRPMMCMSVDLPEPDGPTMPMSSP